jgi:hypothetical protein
MINIPTDCPIAFEGISIILDSNHKIPLPLELFTVSLWCMLMEEFRENPRIRHIRVQGEFQLFIFRAVAF